MLLKIMDSALKLNQRRALVVSIAIREDPHLTNFLPCLIASFSSPKSLCSLFKHSACFKLTCGGKKTQHVHFSLMKSVSRNESDPRRYFHLPFCPCCVD